MFKFPDLEFTLYHKEEEVVMPDTIDGVPDEFKPYVTLKLYINKHSGFHFCCSVPNWSYCGRNPFSCILRATLNLAKQDLKFERVKENLHKRKKYVYYG